MPTDREVCCIIMPFSQTSSEHNEAYWTDHFERVLKPTIEKNLNVEVRRSRPLRGEIVREIIKDLVASRVVVAELTDNNPNVFWELGIRQSFKHGTITIAERSDKGLPFDIGGKGTLFYNPKDHLQMQKFYQLLPEAVQDCLDHPDRPDSVLLETMSGRGSLFEIFQRDEALRRLDGVLSELRYNSFLLRAINWRVADNVKARKTGASTSFETGRLRLPATELLLTNRYVDADASFFETAEKYWDEIASVNDQLNLWEHSQRITEDWLAKNADGHEKVATEFEEVVKALREGLSKKF